MTSIHPGLALRWSCSFAAPGGREDRLRAEGISLLRWQIAMKHRLVALGPCWHIATRSVAAVSPPPFECAVLLPLARDRRRTGLVARACSTGLRHAERLRPCPPGWLHLAERVVEGLAGLDARRGVSLIDLHLRRGGPWLTLWSREASLREPLRCVEDWFAVLGAGRCVLTGAEATHLFPGSQPLPVSATALALHRVNPQLFWCLVEGGPEPSTAPA